MKFYLVHSREFDYVNEFYHPIKTCPELWGSHDIILPHDKQTQGYYSKPVIKDVDAILAEVSYPSTGMGIELGWADMMDKPILGVHRMDSRPSTSVHTVCNRLKIYGNHDELIICLIELIKSMPINKKH